MTTASNGATYVFISRRGKKLAVLTVSAKILAEPMFLIDDVEPRSFTVKHVYFLRPFATNEYAAV